MKAYTVVRLQYPLMKHTLIVLVALQLAPFSGAVRAADLSIENGSLAVRYDEASRTFSLLHKPTGRTFAKNAAFSQPIQHAWLAAGSSAPHSIFGQGKGIEFDHADGSVSRIDLYPQLEFAVFTRIVRNSTKEPRVVDKLTLFSAELDVGRGPNDLRVSGSRPDVAAPGNGDAPSHVFAAVVQPMSRQGVVGGWLTHDRGAGVIYTPATPDKKAAMMRPQIDYGAWRIPAGKDGTTEAFALGWFEDARLGLEAYADTVARLYDIRMPKPPVGLCTWYMEKNQFSCSEKELPKLIEFAARELKPYGFDFIQLDDGWQAGESHFSGPRKQFLNVNKGAFPSGMKAAAGGIQAAGLTAGIWFIPFAGDSQDPYFAPHHDWFIKRKRDGKPFDAYWGGTCLDMTHDGARDYLRRIVSTLRHDWGYTLFKMDGLFTGIGVDHVEGRPHFDDLGDGILANPAKTQIEAYRDGLKLVRETAGKDVFLLGCNIPQNMRSFGGSFGLVDAMRIGPDTGGAMGAGPGSRVWFLNGRVWWNDPDCVIVRPDKCSLNVARRNATWPAIAGQLYYVSDWLPDLPAERVEILKRTMLSHGLTTARPVDVLDSMFPQTWLLTDIRGSVRRDVVAIYKWWGQAAPFTITTERLGLPPAKEYIAFDFWRNEFLPPFQDKLAITLEKDGCSVLAVRPVADHPQLLSTSRHVTQGIVDVTGETWDSTTRTLSGVSAVVGNDPYELRIAMPVDGGWRATGVDLESADVQAGVTSSATVDRTNLRVRLLSPTSRPVRWSVPFRAR
jgi:hypothetical protein